MVKSSSSRLIPRLGLIFLLLLGLLAIVGGLSSWGELQALREGASRRLPVGTGGGLPKLSIDPKQLELGEVDPDPEIRHSFQVWNASEAKLVVDHVSVSCDCTSVSPPAFSLEPGDSQEVVVTIDLTRASLAGGSRTRKIIESSVAFVFDSGEAQEVSLRGVVTYPFAVPATLSINEPLKVGQPAKPQRFTVWKDSKVRELQVSVSPAEAELLEIASLATDSSSVFEIVPAANRPLGKFSFDVHVDAIDQNAKHHGPATIRVSGRVGSDIGWSPQEVLLVRLDAHSVPQEDVVLWSDEGESFEILPEIKSPDFVSVSVEAPRAGFEETTRIVHIASTDNPGKRVSGTILLRVRSSSGRELQVPIPVDLQPLVLETDGSEEGKTASETVSSR